LSPVVNINLWIDVTIGDKDTGEKFAASVNNASGQFATGVTGSP
jgi:hypothetical protein